MQQDCVLKWVGIFLKYHKIVIQLADTHHFPIVIFKNEVRFMDITQEIHSLLIKKNYQTLSDLEDYSNRLNQLLLSSNSQQRILQLLHDYLKMTVFYRTNQGKVHVISKKTSAKKINYPNC